jgi:uncharacterized protein (TIGR02266 family)
MGDQREHPRLLINHEFASLDEFIAEYVTDISQGGVFIRSRAPLSIGTRVDLHFTILLDDFHAIEGVGEVVRVVESGPGQGMGVRFLELTPDSRTLVDRIESEHLTRGTSTDG